MTEYAQHLQNIAGFLKTEKVIVVNRDGPNHNPKRLQIGRRKVQQMKAGRTRV